MIGSAVKRISFSLVAMIAFGSMAVARPDSDAQRIVCEGAAKDWVPVRMPEAGVNVAIPCNDNELSEYKNAIEERKNAEGVAGCERDRRTFIIMYLVNTPADFFDRFTSQRKHFPSQNFKIVGHRGFRAVEIQDGEPRGYQLVEIDASRSVLMSSKSKIRGDKNFEKITSCFFNTIHVVQP